MFWALQLVTVLVPGAVFHLYAACKNIDQEEILERPIYTVFYIISVLLRIILEVIAFWLQSHLFGFQVGKSVQPSILTFVKTHQEVAGCSLSQFIITGTSRH